MKKQSKLESNEKYTALSEFKPDTTIYLGVLAKLYKSAKRSKNLKSAIPEIIAVEDAILALVKKIVEIKKK